MTDTDRDRDQALARQGRVTALVIAVAIVLWLIANALGAMWNWPARFALLFDFAALGALIWAFVNIFDMWRKRKARGG